VIVNDIKSFFDHATGRTAAGATTWASPREPLPGQLRGERNGQKSPTLIGFASGMGLMADIWGRELSPSLFIMEVEDPRYAQRNPALGDPQARVRFYERLGARALPVPYFQPALGLAGQRVPHMMLMVSGGAGAPAGTQHVNGRIVEGFLTDYLEECEGSLRLDDTNAQALPIACRPGGLPLVRVSELPA
jgi:hypothetical protein